MSENRFWFVIDKGKLEYVQDNVTNETITVSELEDLLNEQQELIEELQASDEMGWKRAEMFEKKCPKELHNKKMYIKRLEYKVQKFKEENEQLKKENKKLIEEWEFSFRTEMAHHRFAEKELKEKIRKKQATITELEKRLEHYKEVEAMNGDGKNE